METKSLPTVAQNVIKHYAHLNLGGKEIACPYYINIGHIKDLRVMVGKGTPEEIEMETRIWAQLKGLDLKEMSGDQIRDFMRQRNIGVDCSGFVYHVLNTWLISEGKASLINHIKFPYLSLLGRIKMWLRPAENIGVEVITSDLNTQKIKLAEIKPGDLIRSKSPRQKAQHVLLITDVAYENNKPVAFNYAHSISSFGKADGVRFGKVEINDVNGELKDQQWLETATDGSIPALDGLKTNYEDNGLRRPNFLTAKF